MSKEPTRIQSLSGNRVTDTLLNPAVKSGTSVLDTTSGEIDIEYYNLTPGDTALNAQVLSDYQAMAGGRGPFVVQTLSPATDGAGPSEVIALDYNTLTDIGFGKHVSLIPASYSRPTSPKPDVSALMPDYIRLLDAPDISPFIGKIQKTDDHPYIDAVALRDDGTPIHIFHNPANGTSECASLCQHIAESLD